MILLKLQRKVEVPNQQVDSLFLYFDFHGVHPQVSMNDVLAVEFFERFRQLMDI